MQALACTTAAMTNWHVPTHAANPKRDDKWRVWYVLFVER
jgi:hypothetical protein